MREKRHVQELTNRTSTRRQWHGCRSAQPRVVRRCTADLAVKQRTSRRGTGLLHWCIEAWARSEVRVCAREGAYFLEHGRLLSTTCASTDSTLSTERTSFLHRRQTSNKPGFHTNNNDDDDDSIVAFVGVTQATKKSVKVHHRTHLQQLALTYTKSPPRSTHSTPTINERTNERRRKDAKGNTKAFHDNNHHHN